MSVITNIADIFVAEVSIPAVREASRKAGLMGTAVFARSSVLDEAAKNSADKVTVPAWRSLGGNESLQTPGTPSTTNKVTQGRQVAPILRREENYEVDGFAAAIGTQDPIGFVSSELGAARAYRFQKAVGPTLRGFFGAAAAAAKLNIAVEVVANVTAETKISNNAFLDACELMGENKSMLDKGAVIFTHPVIETALNKQEAVIFVKNSAGEVMLKLWKGMQIVTDSSLVRDGATSGKVYQTYVLAPASIGLGEAPQTNDVGPASLMVDVSAGKNAKAIYDRTSMFIAPKGAKFIGEPASESGPTNAELAVAANWNLVLDADKIGMVALETNG